LATYAEPVRFVGRGHPNVRATHHKTFEFTPAADITERATCVIAVDVRTVEATPRAGAVTITLQVANQAAYSVHARAHSGWLPGSTAVVRRSPMELPDTYATCAGAAAADLPRPLVAAAHSPDAVITIDVAAAADARPIVVLYAADPARPADDRLRAEIAAAHRIVCEDPVARRLADPPASGAGPRMLVLATRELPGATVLDTLADTDTGVETVGLPAQLAAAAASPSRAPLTIATERPAQALRKASPQHRLLVRAPAADVPTLVELAGDLRPDSVVVLTQQFAPPIRLRAGERVSLPTADVTYCCFAPSPARDQHLDPAVANAIRALLDDGVPTRAAARALAELTGIGRRAAYDRVLDLAAAEPTRD
jgi:hypothetical protein